VFISAGYEECIARAKQRSQEQQADAKAVEKLYRERYYPGFEKYMDEVQPKRLATVVIYN
jgi:hypothetical protein